MPPSVRGSTESVRSAASSSVVQRVNSSSSSIERPQAKPNYDANNIQKKVESQKPSKEEVAVSTPRKVSINESEVTPSQYIKNQEQLPQPPARSRPQSASRPSSSSTSLKDLAETDSDQEKPKQVKNDKPKKLVRISSVVNDIESNENLKLRDDSKPSILMRSSKIEEKQKNNNDFKSEIIETDKNSNKIENNNAAAPIVKLLFIISVYHFNSF